VGVGVFDPEPGKSTKSAVVLSRKSRITLGCDDVNVDTAQSLIETPTFYCEITR
jgi:hypothetical protein